MSESQATERLYRIVKQGLCIGCGLCESVAGEENIQVRKTTSGYEAPVVVGNVDDQIVDRIYAVCPGTQITGLPAGRISDQAILDNVWGYWRRIARAYAADESVRYEGSTGGVLTALADYLLASQRVSFILHAKPSATEPTFGEPQMSFSLQQVHQGIGSRYAPTAVLRKFSAALDRNEPFAVVAKPCDIAAIRNFARYDERVDQLLRYTLVMVCGGFSPPSSTNDFLARNNINQKDVNALRYRGRGCPGPTSVTVGDQVQDFHYLDFWGEDESQWSLPFRCKICPDGIGEAADIAASDTWVGGSPSRDDAYDIGTNAVVVRTTQGLELFEGAVQEGFIAVEYDITPDDMSIYQPHQMHKKYAVHGRLLGLADEHRIVPATEGLRIKELSDELPASHQEHQRQGTRNRIKAGKCDVPTHMLE